MVTWRCRHGAAVSWRCCRQGASCRVWRCCRQGASGRVWRLCYRGRSDYDAAHYQVPAARPAAIAVRRQAAAAAARGDVDEPALAGDDEPQPTGSTIGCSDLKLMSAVAFWQLGTSTDAPGELAYGEIQGMFVKKPKFGYAMIESYDMQVSK
mgnify:CR=1 FL=1